MRIWSRLAALKRHQAQPTRNDEVAEPADPELELARQREMLRRVRRELVALAAERNRLTMQIERLSQRSIRASERARRAVASGLDEQARFQLLRKQAAERQLAALEMQRDRLAEDELRLVRTERQLAQRVDTYRKRYRELVGRGASSEALVRLGAAKIARRFNGDNWDAGAVERNRRSA